MNISLKSFQIKNFKAIRDSKTIKFEPLTVFIGNNGSGKSSVIEALSTYQMIVRDGLDEAMNYWRGFEHIRNQAVRHNKRESGVKRPHEENPIEFMIRWKNYFHEMTVNQDTSGNELFIQKEILNRSSPKTVFTREDNGEFFTKENQNQKENLHLMEKIKGNCLDDESLISKFAVREKFKQGDIFTNILNWQFINLNPHLMFLPKPRKRTNKHISLASDGSNIAEYILNIYNLDKNVFNGIVETLQYILPYARDLQPYVTSELERNVYLQLTENDFKIPTWLLSTGTLRILALLAVLRHPQPAPLIVIEEIENGLDPRSIHLIVDEIRSLVETGTSQIIITTHSPYLLDLLTLSQIIFVERDETGQPTFNRPADQESLQEWSKKFGPGKLYTMDRLSQKG
ncbi:ATP-binding protein [Anabaena cylindrica FACHB-243]|uniref:SMC domain protein n=1 Tax=Anabaena cylindrica (strain ATCC 27899 / PCC 7122) TaxID=272123 RepID=K9ZQH3_ANACC|nr:MULTISPECIES: ATP-binding protein [Anabaena]AFZ61426.1 SMC domain protein [Anabaena cylindrica PCC 7122]MBD2419571.1 ATP-binding protein [Anabaena cylindrica FACHB-243]MBY5284161.1 ATP-binding protein [Anabaena sp. CCAP 1446/1C]MBY5309320.1 ATP-binding protein [Anabaena sp. CCAP 1446/1C]MCM2409769.1 ATP-binding protein [Anabaena sp. CCAP 1446/1C]